MDSIDDEALMRIIIEDGEYSGVVFCFGSVRFVEPISDEPLKIEFDYDILEKPLKFSEEGFDKVAFDILLELLDDSRRHKLEPNRGTNPNLITKE
jgi:hypothetical protein